MRKLIFILAIAFLAHSFTANANDTITFTWKGGVNKQFELTATKDKHFIVYWGDNYITDTIATGVTGYLRQIISHTYIDSSDYTVTIIGKSADCLFTYFGFSYQQLRYLDLSKNTALQYLRCQNNQLGSLDLSKNTALEQLDCSNNQLSSLVFGNTMLQQLYCNNNQLLLSELYTASGKVINTNNKRLGLQFLPARQTTVGDTVDFSSQAIFNNINTDFVVYTDYLQGIQAIINVDYTINNGVIIFKKGGRYVITMTNTAIKSASAYPAMVCAEFNVREKNTDATLANITVSEGVLNPVFHSDTLNYIVDVAHNISEINIMATVNDTNATISGDIGTQQLAVGTNIFTITVTAEDKTTIQNYTIIVNRSDTIPDSTSIVEITQKELIINNIEIFDILGRKYVARHCGFDPQSSTNHIRQEIVEQVRNYVLHLPNGIYILKMQTDKGIVIKRIIKN